MSVRIFHFHLGAEGRVEGPGGARRSVFILVEVCGVFFVLSHARDGESGGAGHEDDVDVEEKEGDSKITSAFLSSFSFSLDLQDGGVLAGVSNCDSSGSWSMTKMRTRRACCYWCFVLRCS